jgi:hypothetical protein
VGVGALYHLGAAVDQFGHDLAQPLRPDHRSDVHRMHHVGDPQECKGWVKISAAIARSTDCRAYTRPVKCWKNL